MGFENTVRPFQSVDVTYPRRIIKADSSPPENVVLKVGDNGGAKTLAYSHNYSLMTYMKKIQKEVAKKPVVFSPNDPNYPPMVQPGIAVPVH